MEEMKKGIKCKKHSKVRLDYFKIACTKCLEEVEAKSRSEVTIEDLKSDIWINLLNKPSYEDIGKLVIERLMSKKAGVKYHARKIIVTGS